MWVHDRCGTLPQVYVQERVRDHGEQIFRTFSIGLDVMGIVCMNLTHVLRALGAKYSSRMRPVISDVLQYHWDSLLTFVDIQTNPQVLRNKVSWLVEEQKVYKDSLEEL